MTGNYQTPWHLESAGFSALWQKGLSGAGVRVGLLDSGLDDSLPALHGRVAGFQSFDSYGRPEPAPVHDSSGHGTYSAALLCGARGSRTPGAAPDARLVCGVVAEGGQVPLRLAAGLVWLLEQAPDVVVVPVALNRRLGVFDAVLAEYEKRAIPVFCPAGNRGAGRAGSPGDHPAVLTVGALGRDGTPAAFSGSLNRQGTRQALKPELAAPGVEVLSAWPHLGERVQSGTSSACALVGGAAALLRQARPEAPAAWIREALCATARPLEPDYAHLAVFGAMNLPAALDYLLSMQELVPETLPPAGLPDRTLAAPRIEPALADRLRISSADARLEVLLMLAVGVDWEKWVLTLGTENGSAGTASRWIGAARLLNLAAGAGLIRSALDDPQVEAACLAGVTPGMMTW